MYRNISLQRFASRFLSTLSVDSKEETTENVMRNILVILCLVAASLNLASSKLIELDENNWDQLLTGEWMVEL